MIVFMLLISRHGKTRLNKYYKPFTQKERQTIQKDISSMIIGRSSRLTQFLEWKDYKIVFKRYASLYFAAGIEKEDNELIIHDVIHHFVEVLDKYFGNVCELDLIFNFH
jgi:AP-1 complex subunit sigma 1/2